MASPDGVEKLVRFVKFQRVNSLSVFVEENFGGDESALGGLKVYGVPVLGTNMGDFKRQHPDPTQG